MLLKCMTSSAICGILLVNVDDDCWCLIVFLVERCGLLVMFHSGCIVSGKSVILISSLTFLIKTSIFNFVVKIRVIWDLIACWSN